MSKTFSYVFLAPGDKIMAVHRRLFPEDKPRLFTAVVDAFESGLLKATGHSWVPTQNGFSRKAEPRTKILSLSSGDVMLYQLPESVDLERLKVEKNLGRILLGDGEFSMDLSESE